MNRTIIFLWKFVFVSVYCLSSGRRVLNNTEKVHNAHTGTHPRSRRATTKIGPSCIIASFGDRDRDRRYRAKEMSASPAAVGRAKGSVMVESHAAAGTVAISSASNSSTPSTSTAMAGKEGAATSTASTSAKGGGGGAATSSRSLSVVASNRVGNRHSVTEGVNGGEMGTGAGMGAEAVSGGGGGNENRPTGGVGGGGGDGSRGGDGGGGGNEGDENGEIVGGDENYRPEMGWRVKLYQLNDEGQWDDQGTGHISCRVVESLGGTALVVLAEDDGRELMQSKVGCPDCALVNRGIRSDMYFGWFARDLIKK